MQTYFSCMVNHSDKHDNEFGRLFSIPVTSDPYSQLTASPAAISRDHTARL
jgi:hypothetical protein